MERRNTPTGKTPSGHRLTEREILERKRQLRRAAAQRTKNTPPGQRSARPDQFQRVSLDDLFKEEPTYLNNARDDLYLDKYEPTPPRHSSTAAEQCPVATSPKHRSFTTASAHRSTPNDPESRSAASDLKHRDTVNGSRHHGTTYDSAHRDASAVSEDQENSDTPKTLKYRDSPAEQKGSRGRGKRRTAKKKPAKQKNRQPVERRAMTGREIIQSFLIRLVTFVVLLWVLFGLVFGITPMANADMQPAICAGDLMLYYRMEKKLNSDDVVVFKADGKQYTGRIVAKGGDTVEITSDSQLKVNDSIVVENDIFYSTPQYDTDVTYPIALNDGEYFILCDSREGAKDSRSFGAVNKNAIKGKVITIIRRSGI